MAVRSTLGVVQVAKLTVEDLNYALRKLGERIDTLYGLKGPVTLYNSINLQEGDTINVDGDDALASGDHATLTHLAWTASGHTSTTQPGIAGFNGSGVALEYGTQGTGDVVLDQSPTIETPTLNVPVIDDFSSATHTHETTPEGGVLVATPTNIGMNSGDYSFWRGMSGSTTDPDFVVEALDFLARNHEFAEGLQSNPLWEALTESINVPGLRAPGCFAYQFTAQTAQAVNTANVMTFSLELFDTDSFHAPVTNNSRLTAPFAGKYLIEGGVALDLTGVTTPSIAAVYIIKNGTAGTLYGVNSSSVLSLPSAEIGVTALMELNAGDYVELVSYVAGAAGTYATYPSGTLPYEMHLGCVYLGQ